jgi:hypothetical protein
MGVLESEGQRLWDWLNGGGSWESADDIGFCVPWDVNFNTCIPFNLSPAVNQGDLWTPGKFDAACLRSPVGNYGTNEWTGITTLPGDEGAIGIWAKSDDPTWGEAHVWLRPASGSNSRLDMSARTHTTSGLSYVDIDMWDSSGAKIFGVQTFHSQDTLGSWNYFELDWLWNDAGGNTQVFVNSTKIYEHTAGNSKTRNGAQTTKVFARCQPNDTTDYFAYIDDLNIYDARKHTANFDPPTEAQCCRRWECLGRLKGLAWYIRNQLQAARMKVDNLERLDYGGNMQRDV